MCICVEQREMYSSRYFIKRSHTRQKAINLHYASISIVIGHNTNNLIYIFSFWIMLYSFKWWANIIDSELLIGLLRGGGGCFAMQCFTCSRTLCRIIMPVARWHSCTRLRCCLVIIHIYSVPNDISCLQTV